MKIEQISLFMPNAVKIPMTLKEDEFQKGFDKLRSIEYEQNVYRTAPNFYKISEKDKNEELRKVEFYMPISEVPDNFPYEVIRVFEVEDTILLRQADLEPNLSIARQKISAYAKENYNRELSSDMYCVCVDLYNEILIDLYIPML